MFLRYLPLLAIILTINTAHAKPCDTEELNITLTRLMDLTSESVDTMRKLRVKMNEQDAREAIKQLRERRSLVGTANAKALECALSVMEYGNGLVSKDKEFEMFLLRIFPDAGADNR